MDKRNSHPQVVTPLIWFFKDVFPFLLYISPGQWIKSFATRKLRSQWELDKSSEVAITALRNRELTIVELWVICRFIVLSLVVFSASPSLIRSYFWWSVIVAVWMIMEPLIAVVVLVAIKPAQGNAPDNKIEYPLRTIFLVFINYMQITLMFAVLFICASSDFRNTLDAFYFSTISITTLGYNDITHSESSTKWLVIFELYAGLILVVLSISILVSKLSAIVRVTGHENE